MKVKQGAGGSVDSSLVCALLLSLSVVVVEGTRLGVLEKDTKRISLSCLRRSPILKQTHLCRPDGHLFDNMFQVRMQPLT